MLVRSGKADLELPVLGVGCWSFGGGSYWGAQEDRDVDAVVSAALDRGCAFFDTAEGYNEGRSEEALGRSLRGRRHKAIVASKISPDHCAPDLVRRHCEASLAHLDTDYLDLYLIHWPINPLAIRHFSSESAVARPPSLAEALGALELLRREGKIRHIGLSNFGARQLDEALASGVEIACDELPYSLLSRAIEWEVLPFCGARGIGILGYMPLMQGLLTGKYRSADELPPNRTRTRHFRGDRPGSRHGESGAEEKTFRALDAIRAIAERERVSMERLAIAWSVARPEVTSTIVGARTASQLLANADAASTSLTPELCSELDQATEALRHELGRAVDLFESSTRSRTY